MLDKIFDGLTTLIAGLVLIAAGVALIGGFCWIAFWIWQHVFAFFM